MQDSRRQPASGSKYRSPTKLFNLCQEILRLFTAACSGCYSFDTSKKYWWIRRTGFELWTSVLPDTTTSAPCMMKH